MQMKGNEPSSGMSILFSFSAPEFEKSLIHMMFSGEKTFCRHAYFGSFWMSFWLENYTAMNSL